MKLFFSQNRRSGFSMLTVTIIAGGGLVVVGAILSWSCTNTRLAARENHYWNSVAAAEAATEKVIACMARDFQSGGESVVSSNLVNYRQLVPGIGSLLSTLTGTLSDTLNGLAGGAQASVDSNVWANFEFSDAQGHTRQTYAERLSLWGFTSSLQTHLKGIGGNASTYRVVSNARDLKSPFNTLAALKQEVQIASVPIFQFQIFYNTDLEICPGANMTITGPIHCNGTIYLEPNAKILTFRGMVNASEKILHRRHPDDPVERTFGSVVYGSGRQMRLNTLNLPIGTSNSPASLRAIVEIPPNSESASSLMGQQRYYNKADLIILVSAGSVVAKSGTYNNFLVSIPGATLSPFLNTNLSFFNKRESSTVKGIEIDIEKFRDQYTLLSTLLGRNPKVVYVADLRPQGAYSQAGIRLVNGQTLPSAGFTLATPNPLYVKGHYNAPSPSAGTNTAGTVPASLVADAITILSGNWNDTNSSSILSARNAASTTVNAGVIAGIVRTGSGYYSGGAENFFRFLEDWSGDTFTFNGSTVVLFESRTATGPWGASADVYNIPTRNYALDANFTDPAKLPPGTPEARTLIRSQWAILPPNQVQ